MKAILHLSILGLLAGALTGLAQTGTPPPAEPSPVPGTVTQPAVSSPAQPAQPDALPAANPPADPSAVAAPPEMPAPDPVSPAPAPPADLPDGALPVPAAETPANPNGDKPATEAPPVSLGDEVVPLIVIDDVPLTDAIRNLARQADINFMFDPQITTTNQPNISLRWENVTAQEALKAVLDNYNLSLVKLPQSKIARIAVKDPQAEEPLFTKVIQLKYCDPTNLVEVVKPTLSTRSKVLADIRTRQLIVTTTEKEMEGLIALVDQLDSRTKQVLIEARIYETMKNPRTVKGINWEGTLGAQNVTFGNNSSFQNGLEPARPTLTDPGYGGSYSGLLPGTPRVIGSAANGPFFNPTFAFMNADGVNAVVSFLNKDTDTELIATPRAVTLDNQTAELSVTRAYPVFQITPGSANSPAGATVTYTNLGTILRVTPRIAADSNVSLSVIPEVSDIAGKDEQTLNGQRNIANIYSVRRIETQVMVPSGATLVMGGLIDDRTTKLYSKVPLLGDIPLLGFMFRHSDKSREKKNMIVFVTPTIVQDTDFHLTSAGTDYLRTEFAEKPEVEANAWDSAKPHDWTKPVE